VRRKRDMPAPSLLELQRKERDDRARVPGPVSATAPETQGPCSGPPVAKSLVYGPRPGSSWGDRVSSPTRFNTYSRGSTHLGAARPGPDFFLSFESLKPGRWDLGPGLVETQDSGLRPAGTLPCPARPCWPPSQPVNPSPVFAGPGPIGRTCTPELRHRRTDVVNLHIVKEQWKRQWYRQWSRPWSRGRTVYFADGSSRQWSLPWSWTDSLLRDHVNFNQQYI
jgi:hypothetical protein